MWASVAQAGEPKATLASVDMGAFTPEPESLVATGSSLGSRDLDMEEERCAGSAGAGSRPKALGGRGAPGPLCAPSWSTPISTFPGSEQQERAGN